ncbi:cytochrome oxidase Cu insertion factor (SCO1/SenC/PrrC family) [Algoriphagus ratkowskyi]|uniref:Cytochrome oxidase Cu insertion factor (SCO1/SenC/PrrC family) n=1 Tax=Algoriphagus ratkowskyi TaxID=57028 RepID=A0A2W7R9M0_9BACT|nr:TlpA disulfide reductase family protein [Algoriphagus ratkowskyi]PZX57603.1 cytochrome oxidase Cu insertion factor (SCO1/SenC/PrrC family) [Algoriphagus ratkowskyi]TXD78877.1 TlpA family protein disulfide reductase [Algoriphagus ratkowskyi]
MHKFLFLCFLGQVCVVGSTIQAQDVNSNSLSESKVANHPKAVPWNGSEQKGGISSAQNGALIYGEIINPDSLGPLKLVYAEQKFSGRISTGEQEVTLIQEQGMFLDGVLNSQKKKFRIQVPQDSMVYVSLLLDGRVLLEDYLLHPSDSVMISMDLGRMNIVFGGPESVWMEAQFATKRGGDNTFNSRILLEQDKENFLNQQDNRAQWEQYQEEFGPKLKIFDLGMDGADYAFSQLMDDDYAKIPGWNQLLVFKSAIPSDRFDLLQADLVGNYYAEILRSFRQYQYGIPQIKGQRELLDRMNLMLPELSRKIKIDLDSLEPNLISQGYYSLASEWVKLDRMISGEAFETIVTGNFQGGFLDKLLVGNLLDRIKFTADELKFWENYTVLIKSDTWKRLADKTLAKYQTGQVVDRVIWKDLAGKEWTLDDFKGKATLFYFYFSTCSNSEKYFKNYLLPLYQETAELANYQLVAVSVDDDQALWKSSLTTYSNTELINLNFPLSENKAWLNKYHIQGYPGTLLIDGEGRVLSFHLNGEDYKDYRDRFLKVLSTPSINSSH